MLNLLIEMSFALNPRCKNTSHSTKSVNDNCFLSLSPKVPFMPNSVRKENLPFKTCVVCLKPFTWRKKWEKYWSEVRYCSDSCRMRRKDLNRDGTKG
jgi:hypothetical protein